jgi:phage baseplate assembly protein W
MFQPKYPLSLSDLEGAYDSIKDIKENVKQNVMFLLLTSEGEWPGRPEIGVGVRRFLFSNYPSPEILGVHKKIKDQFARYMPFIEIESQLIDKDEMGVSFIDRNEIKLVVRYAVPSIAISETVVLNVSENSGEILG